MNIRNQRSILALALGLFLLGGIVAFYMYNKPHRNIGKEKSDFTMTASELFEAFEEDENIANTKYLDKVVRVSGEIREVLKTENGNMSYVLDVPESLMGGVQVSFDNRVAAENSNLKPGSNVELKCRCTGMLMDVVLVDCFPVNE